MTEGSEKEENVSVVRRPDGRPKNETAEERRIRKKEVKDAKSEVRKTKIKKHVKKRAEKKKR